MLKPHNLDKQYAVLSVNDSCGCYIIAGTVLSPARIWQCASFEDPEVAKQIQLLKSALLGLVVHASNLFTRVVFCKYFARDNFYCFCVPCVLCCHVLSNRKFMVSEFDVNFLCTNITLHTCLSTMLCY